MVLSISAKRLGKRMKFGQSPVFYWHGRKNAPDFPGEVIRRRRIRRKKAAPVAKRSSGQALQFLQQIEAVAQKFDFLAGNFVQVLRLAFQFVAVAQ